MNMNEKPQYFISNKDDYFFQVERDVAIDLEQLKQSGCIFHASLNDMYDHVQKQLKLMRDEVEGLEIVIIKSDGVLKESQHAYFSEIELGQDQTINHYIIGYIN